VSPTRGRTLQGRFAPFPSLSLGSAQPSGRRCRATSTTPGSRKGGTTVNAVHLIGRITQDITVREHGDTKVAQLRLAIPRGRDKNGEDRGADFVDVVCIAVEGRLHHDEWDGENGRRQKLEVIAQSIEFLDARKTDGEPAEQTEPAAA
jgi:single-stranded DNA-binding protein